MSYEEEDACMSYEEEDTCMLYEEEDTCMSYEEEDTCLTSSAVRLSFAAIDRSSVLQPNRNVARQYL
jgi:hypothetical protein